MTQSSYSRSPKLLKGALISFSSPMLIPIPNLIIFQYNPESISRSLSPWAPQEAAGGEGKETKASSSLAQPNDPEETFTLNLEVDATDALEEPASHPVAVVSGVADRLAAMEMLLYPPDDSGGMFGLSVSVSVSVGGSGLSAGGSAAAAAVPRKKVPIVLLFWGPGRIVPVRLTSFSVEEQAFSPLLYPVRAKVAVGLKILDQAALDKEDPKGEDAVVQIAKATYVFTRTQKQVLALANLANSVESIMGMLPF